MDKSLLNKIHDELIKEEYIVFSYIFGSFVTRERYNDIDIAIYLANDELDTFEYLNLKRRMMDIASTEVDIIILNKASSLIKKEIFKHGVQLFSRNRDLETDFIVRSLFEYEDMKKYYNLSYSSMINQIRKEVGTNG